MEEINQKYNTEYTNRLVEHKAIFHELYDAWGPSWAGNCGGYLFDGRTYVYDHTSYEKQELLYEKAKHATSVLEVGSYVGHSLFIMLLANPTLKITSIDICDEYTGPAIRVLNKHFNNCIRFIHADSITGMTQLQNEGAKFDLFHLDGDHYEELIIQEYSFCSRMSSLYPRVKIVFDDEISLRGFSAYLQGYRKNVKVELPNCGWSNIYIEFDEPEIKRTF
jgi:predicted O-methyltransferase YrrM